MTIWLLLVAVGAMLVGLPIGYALGLGAVVALVMASGLPSTVIPQRMMVNVDSFAIMAIPFYVLAGEIMTRGGVSRRLVGLATALVGHMRAGLTLVTVISSMIFAGISGSAAADTAAIGSIMIPAMTERRYKPGFAAALVAMSGAMGPIIPPSLVMILYGSMTGVSIASLFLGGLIPGVLIGVVLMVIGYFWVKRLGFDLGGAKLPLKERWKAVKDASFALVLPVIILGGIIFGVFTPTEAGVVAVVYALVVSMFVYREMSWKDLPSVFFDSAVSTATILLIVATASAGSWLLAAERFPDKVVSVLTAIGGGQAVTLFLLIVFVLLVGCLVETVAGLILLTPVLFPVGQMLGFDPIHFGVVIGIATILAGETPPVSVLTFITTKLARCKYSETLQFLWPFLLATFGVLLLAAYVPQLVTGLPQLLLR